MNNEIKQEKNKLVQVVYSGELYVAHGLFLGSYNVDVMKKDKINEIVLHTDKMFAVGDLVIMEDAGEHYRIDKAVYDAINDNYIYYVHDKIDDSNIDDLDRHNAKKEKERLELEYENRRGY